MAVAGGLAGVCMLVLSGCSDDQNTLAPHSSAARSITTLWWVMFIGSTIVVMVVTLLVVLAVLKRRGRLDRIESRGESPGARNVVLISGALVPAVVLTALFIYVLTTVPATAEPKPTDARMTVDVTGKQWFWAVRYPAQRIVTANEIHIPVGVPVRIRAHTGDVIHSFWVPELNRKIDLIPGRENSVLLDANRAGTYLGQCSEFCGLQHAHMELIVVVESRSRFEQWLHGEETNAQQPSGATAERGLEVFMSAGCADCHQIRGTPAKSQVGPDLTHLAARSTLAAGTIANDRAGLARWLRDPQGVKPGNKMPALPLKADEVDALVAYLEGLK